MRGRIKKKWAWFGGTAVAIVALAALMVIPAIGAEDAVVLDATASPYGFVHGGDFDAVVAVDGCLIGGDVVSSSGGDLVRLTGSGNGYKGPGVVGTAIGVKTGGANGTPCSFTEQKSNETLTVASTNGAWERLDLDLELKDNAWVVLTLSNGQAYHLVSGSSIETSGAPTPTDTTLPYSAYSDTPTVPNGSGGFNNVVSCANPSDSGPDSGINDNCYWTVVPTATFTSFTISLKEGSVTLDGGGDGSELSPTKFHYSQYDAIDDTVNTDEDAFVDDFDPIANNDAPVSATFDSFDFGGSTPLGVTDNGDGTFDFDPRSIPDYQALDAGDTTSFSFGYTAHVGSSSDSATVTVNVAGRNDQPDPGSACGSDFTCSATTLEDTAVDIDLADDVDESAVLTVVCGDPRVDDSGTDGVITFTPALNESGPTSFSCTVTDGQISSVIPVTVNVSVTEVNDPPTANADTAEVDDRAPTGTANLNQPDSVDVTVVTNDTDVETPSGALTAALDGPITASYVDPVSGLPTAFAGYAGSASASGGTITYTAGIEDDSTEASEWPDGVYEMTVTVPYKVVDAGLLEDSSTLTVTVFRVVCATETVSDEDGDFVSGAFTNVTPNTCKWYEVIAYEDDTNPLDDSVTFVTPPDGDPASPADDVYFLAELTFSPESLIYQNTGGDLIGLKVDIDGDGIFESTMGLCLGDYNALDDPTDYVGDPFPSGDRWCWYRMEGVATDGGLFQRYYIYGSIDPTFKRL